MLGLRVGMITRRSTPEPSPGEPARCHRGGAALSLPVRSGSLLLPELAATYSASSHRGPVPPVAGPEPDAPVGVKFRRGVEHMSFVLGVATAQTTVTRTCIRMRGATR